MDRDPCCQGVAKSGTGLNNWKTTACAPESAAGRGRGGGLGSLRSLFVRRARKPPCVLTVASAGSGFLQHSLSLPSLPLSQAARSPGARSPPGSLVGPREQGHWLQAVLSQVLAFPRAHLRPSASPPVKGAAQQGCPHRAGAGRGPGEQGTCLASPRRGQQAGAPGSPGTRVSPSPLLGFPSPASPVPLPQVT